MSCWDHSQTKSSITFRDSAPASKRFFSWLLILRNFSKGHITHRPALLRSFSKSRAWQFFFQSLQRGWAFLLVRFVLDTPAVSSPHVAAVSSFTRTGTFGLYRDATQGILC